MLVYNDELQGKDCSQYLAGNSPMKAGGYGMSSNKKTKGGPTPIKGTQPGPSAHQPTAFAPQFGQEDDLRVHEQNQPPSQL